VNASGVPVGDSSPAGTELDNERALVALYLLQDFRRVTEASQPPAPGWFHRHGVVVGITGENRKLTARLVRRTDCLACLSPLPQDSTGDHLVALANGGAPGLANYIPLCGRCNSSKRTRDFLEWWELRGRSVAELPVDVLAAYCRLTFQHLRDRRQIGKPAPAWLRRALSALSETLPSPEHERALWRRVQWVTGKP
jgi:hypothetical protein